MPNFRPRAFGAWLGTEMGNWLCPLLPNTCLVADTGVLLLVTVVACLVNITSSSHPPHRRFPLLTRFMRTWP